MRYWIHHFILFIVSVITESQRYRTIVVTLDGSTYLTCGSDEQTYICKFFNPSGELVVKTCTYQFTPTMDDLGEWRCLRGITASMELVEYVMNLELEGNKSKYRTENFILICNRCRWYIHVRLGERRRRLLQHRLPNCEWQEQFNTFPLHNHRSTRQGLFNKF